MIDIIDNHPKFNKTMSRDARKLRSEIIPLCLERGTARMGQTQRNEFKNQIIERYKQINWEKAILYAHPSEIADSVLRIISTEFNSKTKSGKISKGNKSKSARNDIDWLSVAEFDYQWWVQGVKTTRKGKLDPRSINKNLEAFETVYNLFIHWVPVDFSYSALFGVYSLSNKYSISLIKECMDQVENLRQRNIDYVTAIIEREFAIRHKELQENKELMESSKQVLNTIMSVVANKEDIDWDSIDKTSDIDMNNKIEFDKVKLS